MTFPETADAIIIGGGVMGASAAYHLARAGCKSVVLLEQGGFFGAESTGKCAGGIRHQFDTEINVKLSLLSLAMLDRFERELEQPIGRRKCGYLFVLSDARDVPEFQRQVSMQRGLGASTEWLDGDEVRRRLPLFHLPDVLGGTWGPDDGLADPNSVVQGYIKGARRLGARCLSHVKALAIVTGGGRALAVDTTRGRIYSDVVINAAGAWAGYIGALAGIELPIVPVRRQIVVTTALPSLPADLPFVIDFSRRLYFHREGPGVLTGMSNPQQPVGFIDGVDPDWELVHLEAACHRLPPLEQVGVLSRWSGLYENTPDAHPIIGQTELSGFYCLAGFSGHGFMHGPAAGLLLAEQVLGGRATTLDITSLELGRFRRGDAHSEYNIV